MRRIVLRNARIFTPVDGGTPCGGSNQGQLQFYKKGAILAEDGIIAAVGMEDGILSAIRNKAVDEEYNCEGRCVVPGFVDPHTHMCFAALRESEFELRISGVSYLDILEQGGGILSSVKAVAEADVQQLADNTLNHLRRALQMGTTTVEIKSGYGLDTKNELKMLEAIGLAAAATVTDIVPTFLGAHAVPSKYKGLADDYISLIIDEMLPAVVQQGIAKHCDIFCEKNVFSIAQARKLLLAAKKAGMGVKLHADEVYDLGGAALAAELGALSADHLLAANDGGIAAMAAAGVVATLLPATAYSLKKSYARARDMIAQGVPVALATDCNPGSSYTESMPFVIGLAVLNMDMTPAEALSAATLNSAYALGIQNRVGSLERGKQADLLILEGDSPAILAYHAGVSPVVKVCKKGEMVDMFEQVNGS